MSLYQEETMAKWKWFQELYERNLPGWVLREIEEAMLKFASEYGLKVLVVDEDPHLWN